MSNSLNPDKALIFRIVHGDNLPWILDHGLHCRSSNQCDPNYVNISNPELIDRRCRRAVPGLPPGSLAGYVPHNFTPHSPMRYNRVGQRKSRVSQPRHPQSRPSVP